MDKSTKDNHLLKDIISASYRAIAKQHHAKAHFSKIPNPGLKHRGRIYVPRHQGKQEIARSRGEADAEALWTRYHDSKIHAALEPGNYSGQMLFEALELLRVSTLGANQYMGVARNLSSTFNQNIKARRLPLKKNIETLVSGLSLYLWEQLTGQKPRSSNAPLVNLWKDEFQEHLDPQLKYIKENLGNQKYIADIALKLIDKFNLKPEKSQDEKPSPDNPDDKKGKPAKSQQGKEQSKPLSATPSQSYQDKKDETSISQNIKHLFKKSPLFSGQQTADQADDSTDQAIIEGEEALPYHVYTKAFDEILPAEQLCTPKELERLRSLLDQQLDQLSIRITKLANRLQRKLLAQQARSWDRNLDEGMLDSQRLSRVVTTPTTPRAYKKERESKFKDTVVSLLIDNSGSMRGRPIAIAAMCADILARTLERCDVKVEILGFTTVNWKGGRSREQWIQNDKPDNPGRLNDLRHIIYKTADSPWRRSRKNLGLMLREGLLKENIDGEALLWAHKRLVHRSEQRRILIVISDGAPVDDSTLSVNPGNFLDRHLIESAQLVENTSDIELVAIGIGHDVTRSYSHALTIVDAEQLGTVLIEKIEELLDIKI
jgi:cobaltochelatase CobT